MFERSNKQNTRLCLRKRKENHLQKGKNQRDSELFFPSTPQVLLGVIKGHWKAILKMMFFFPASSEKDDKNL